MNDPVEEVEEQVRRIVEEHEVLWGCDDPACAVRTSNLIVEPTAKRSWWRRMLGLR